MADLEKQGCAVCRQQIYSGSANPIATNIARHADLFVCETCGACWEIGERAAWLIGFDEAKGAFPQAFEPHEA
jgi:hypothetical protein